MVDETKPAAAPNPASVASNPNPTASQNNPNTTQEAATKQSLASDPATLKAAQEPVTTGANKQVARSSTLITNPAPAVDPDAPVTAKEVDKGGLPQGTIDEMNAGREALKRNRPVAEALEERRKDEQA